VSTRVTNKSYGSKIGESFKGIIGGFFILIISIALLWWNEHNSLKEIDKISEGKQNTIEINSNQVLSENNGKLVHLSGLASTADTLKDIEFGLNLNAIYLNKTVEQFQYKENKKTEEKENLGGSSTITESFTYEKIWSEQVINSDNFYEKDKINPKHFQHSSKDYYAENVHLDAFQLSNNLIQKINKIEEYPINASTYVDSTKNSVINNGYIYFGENPSNPKIGDERIHFSVIFPHQISVIAQQNNDKLQAYTTKNGRIIALVRTGLVSKEQMYKQEEQKNKILRWVLRLVGFFLMFGGFSAILKPLSTLGSVVPLLGKVINAGTSLISFFIALIISILIIAIAWLFYRPILSIILITIAIAIFFGSRKILNKSGEKNNG